MEVVSYLLLAFEEKLVRVLSIVDCATNFRNPVPDNRGLMRILKEELLENICEYGSQYQREKRGQWILERCQHGHPSAQRSEEQLRRCLRILPLAQNEEAQMSVIITCIFKHMRKRARNILAWNYTIQSPD